ncbi:MAG: cytochrome c3 family protein [Gammaproteobacteria bacterium]|nr:cytochrome c3 family protein [Gammaproteobacteria bacterium]MDH5592929.1 cytochrome c3 family protein [Gammaproteobacteria bacterium]
MKLFSRMIITALLFMTAALSVSEYVWAARDVGEQRECATCHIMWLNEFKRTDIIPLIKYDPTPQETTGRQDIVSTKRMCISCHDGFVLDSRELWKEGHKQHPVGVKPSDKITIPIVEGKNLFPLNSDGKVYCGTCHTAHGIKWGEKESTVFMRVSSRDGNFCQNCHKQKMTGPATGNHPVNKKVKGKLANIGAKPVRLTDEKEVSCQSCHTAHKAANKKLLVNDNNNSEICGSCHADRYTFSMKEAARSHTHPVNLVPEHAKIPQDLIDKGAKLGNDGKIICQTCHTPHGSKTQKSILVDSNQDSSLCQQCHIKQRKVAGGKHDMRLVDANNSNVKKQVVDKAGVCSACHTAHDGKAPKMWARTPGNSKDPMASTCLSCHQTDGLARKHQVGNFSHPVGVDIAKTGNKVSLPTFSNTGVKSINAASGNVTCASCHDVHQWDPKHPQKTAKPGQAGDASNKFLRKVNKPDSALCNTCHKEKWSINGTEHDLSEIAPNAVNVLKQTPEQGGTCSSCHLVHNGKGPRMWARNIPAGTTGPSAPCLSCHNTDGLASDKAIGKHNHPVNSPLEKLGIKATFKSWQTAIPDILKLKSPVPLPLYDEDGHYANAGGNISCGSCHDPHRWDPENASNKDTNVEGDASNSFLRMADKGESALCMNCHRNKASVVLSPHGEKKLAQSPSNEHSATGPCSACHQPHNSKEPYLWARKPGEGKTAITTLCTSCHRDDGHAKNKQTGKNTHPTGIALTKDMPASKLPLYTAKGEKTEHDGKIDCATCHDPHQWNPDNFKSIAGKKANVEGTPANSFLRIHASGDSALCITCHKTQASVQKTDHDLNITAKNAVNQHKQTPAVSGTCGQCHTPHNATSPVRLFAQAPGKGNNINEQLCLGCHAEGKSAKAKIPPETKHPDKVRAWSGPVRAQLRPDAKTHLPIFNKQGKPDTTGIISCPTCHNPHKWSITQEKQPGKNTEGDTSSSFLRLSNTELFLCADCHGLDSLYRYKYFHSSKSHEKHKLTR